MWYIAFCCDSYVFASPHFDSVVKFVQARHRKDKFANDACIWSGNRVAAVVGFDGRVTRFPAPPPGPNSPPAA
jgi:hypothetical protein